MSKFMKHDLLVAHKNSTSTTSVGSDICGAEIQSTKMFGTVWSRSLEPYIMYPWKSSRPSKVAGL